MNELEIYSIIIIQKAFRNTDICSICIKLVKKNNDYCHNFHKKCIIKWKLLNNTCPVCRTNIIKHSEFQYDISIIKHLLKLSKYCFKDLNLHKKALINDKVYKIISREAKISELSIINYILSQCELINVDGNEQKILNYLRTRMIQFIANNKYIIRYSLLNNEHLIKIDYIKKTIKSCKVILSINNGKYNDEFLKIEDAVDFLHIKLPNYLYS